MFVKIISRIGGKVKAELADFGDLRVSPEKSPLSLETPIFIRYNLKRFCLFSGKNRIHIRFTGLFAGLFQGDLKL